jgi:hypothetical protein
MEAYHMSVYLEVPFVSQLTFGGDGASSSYGPQGKRDPTGCWYASACMVAYFFEAGPRLGVPSLYQPGLYGHGGHKVITVGAVSTLARHENLEAVAGSGGSVTGEWLEEQIRSSGPLWFAWLKTNSKGQTYGHACVIIGTNGSSAVFHDPEDAPKSSISLTELNAKLFKTQLADSCMLRRQGARSKIRGQVMPLIRAAL